MLSGHNGRHAQSNCTPPSWMVGLPLGWIRAYKLKFSAGKPDIFFRSYCSCSLNCVKQEEQGHTGWFHILGVCPFSICLQPGPSPPFQIPEVARRVDVLNPISLVSSILLPQGSSISNIGKGQPAGICEEAEAVVGYRLPPAPVWHLRWAFTTSHRLARHSLSAQGSGGCGENSPFI